MSANALQKAIYAALSADAALTALLGEGRILDRQPVDRHLPHVLFGPWRIEDWSTGTEAGAEHVFDIEIWTDDNGRRRAAALADAVRAALHDRALDIEDVRLVNLRHLRTQTRRAAASRLHVARLTFRAAIEQ
jgi:hypothetical protein